MKKSLIILVIAFSLIGVVTNKWIIKKPSGRQNTTSSMPDPDFLISGIYDLPTKSKPYLLSMSSSDFSVNKIDLTQLETQDFLGIHEARAFIMNGQYKLALATYFKPRLIILGSGDSTLKNLKEEFVDDFPYDAGRVRAVYVGDINGDGKDEVVAGSRPDGILRYYEYTNGKWMGSQIDSLGTTIHDILITDSDGDGKQEVFVTTNTTSEYANNISEIKIPEIIKYTLTDGKWNKTVVWQPKNPILEGVIYPHARYLFTGDFDGDGKPEIVTGVVGLHGLYSLLMLKWNGSGYSEYLQDVGNSVKIAAEAITTGDIYGDGKSEILLPTWTGDALLQYKWQGNHWERSILAKNLGDNSVHDDRVMSITILNSESGGYKKILYETSLDDETQNEFDRFYVLAYNPRSKEWEQSLVSKFSLPAYYSWGFFRYHPG